LPHQSYQYAFDIALDFLGLTAGEANAVNLNELLARSVTLGYFLPGRHRPVNFDRQPA